MIKNLKISNCIRDENGAIKLDELVLEKFHYYRKGYATFNYCGNKYYLKQCMNMDKLYNELIAEELADDYGIECSYNDISYYDDEFCIISEEKKQGNVHIIPMSKILGSENDILNNLTDIWNAFEQRYKNLQIVANLLNQLVDIFIFDILIANVDRHSDNYCIVEAKNGVFFNYLFDNENMLNATSIYDGGYSIGIDRDDYFVFENENEHFLRKFLMVSDHFYLEYLKDKLDIISNTNMLSVLRRVEDKIGHSIKPNIKKKVLKKMNDNYNILNNIINEF